MSYTEHFFFSKVKLVKEE